MILTPQSHAMQNAKHKRRWTRNVTRTATHNVHVFLVCKYVEAAEPFDTTALRETYSESEEARLMYM